MSNQPLQGKKEVIQEYFKNPQNVSGLIYKTELRKGVTGEEFYKMGEQEQQGTFVCMKQIECADGFKMSVQACYSHYCEPRITFRSKYICAYNSFEVGFPSKAESLIKKYAEDSTNLTDTVYGRVPASVVNKVISKHGGLK